MDVRTTALIAAMITYDRGDTLRIQHFIKVHDLAVTIGMLEAIDSSTLKVLEAAAVLHDIGIHASELKYGNTAGPHQEELGPIEAERVFQSVNEVLPDDEKYSEEEMERIKFLIAHHHTYSTIDSIDWQILVEADFLVNLFEDDSPTETILQVRQNIFKTQAGTNILDEMFGL